MARIGVYIERYTVNRSEEMEALMRFGWEAQRLGHHMEFLFRPDVYKIPEFDGLFIRALTDPLNSSFVASRTAELHGLRVIDDSLSILICCDKINMYRHLIQAGVSMPDTVFLREADVTQAKAEELLDTLGSPLVLKAPNSSFSLYVDRVSRPKDFVKVGKRYLRRADRILAQRFVPSEFDWRVGILAGEVLYVCQYGIPKRRWKIMTYTESGRVISGPVRAMVPTEVSPALLDTARAAAAATGKGLYGIDIKQSGDSFSVIEVNDNPTIAVGEEDKASPDLYERIVRYLAGEWG
jgi:glutathione synthase/RimK-type ligase-like ATP-grasp enzyme